MVGGVRELGWRAIVQVVRDEGMIMPHGLDIGSLLVLVGAVVFHWRREDSSQREKRLHKHLALLDGLPANLFPRGESCAGFLVGTMLFNTSAGRD